jgi:hypothetical protein
MRTNLLQSRLFFFTQKLHKLIDTGWHAGKPKSPDAPAACGLLGTAERTLEGRRTPSSGARGPLFFSSFDRCANPLKAEQLHVVKILIGHRRTPHLGVLEPICW